MLRRHFNEFVNPAVDQTIDDPCHAFSDVLGMRVVRGSVKKFLLTFLPKPLEPEAREAFHYAARNLEPLPA